jgi:hypothetical protein
VPQSSGLAPLHCTCFERQEHVRDDDVQVASGQFPQDATELPSKRTNACSPASLAVAINTQGSAGVLRLHHMYLSAMSRLLNRGLETSEPLNPSQEDAVERTCRGAIYWYYLVVPEII